MTIAGRRRGSGIVQLIAILFLMLVAVAFLVPTIHGTRSRGCGGSRVKCQSNLSQMGKALLLYSNENKGRFPQTHYVAGAPISITNDGAADTNPFAMPPTPYTTNNIPAAMFLLVRTQDMTTEVFTCPSGTAEKDLMANLAAERRGNFTGENGGVTKNVSYSFVNVYPSDAALAKKYQTLITAYSSDFAVAADLSPLPPDHPAWEDVRIGAPRAVLIRGNSRNHDQDGQNVLYADGHAEYQQTPLSGTGTDNIYTAHAPGRGADISGSGVDPEHAVDSVLLIHEP